MSEYIVTQPELLERLAEQRDMLRTSCLAYDAGKLFEAQRIAATLFILLHDAGKNSRSLLGQLKLKDKISYISSSRGFYMEHCSPQTPSKVKVAPPTPLLTIKITETSTVFAPMCETVPNPVWARRLSFAKWYDEELIFESSHGAQMKRKNLIHHLRSSDGDSHVDPTLNKNYVALKRDSDSRLKMNGDPIPNAHYASMRQIGWEIEESLQSISPQR